MATETEWRRRWKPDLVSCPWQSVEVDDDNYLIKVKFSEESYEVLITDLMSFWHEALDGPSLKQRIEKLNPRIEAPVTKILDQIELSLKKPTKETVLSVSFKNNRETQEKDIILKITSSLAGMPFSWHFYGQMCDSKVARDHLTFPLITMVAELLRRQKELEVLLIAKDKEISDYKSQGARTSRKHIETPLFDMIAFKNNMVTSEGFEKQVKKLEKALFDQEGQELYRQIVMKHAWLRHKDDDNSLRNTVLDDESLTTIFGAAPSEPSWSNRLPPSMMQPKPSVSPTVSPSDTAAKSPPVNPEYMLIHTCRTASEAPDVVAMRVFLSTTPPSPILTPGDPHAIQTF